MSITIDKLCDLIGYRLSDEQLAAVTADLSAPLRVVAGAGSGKTTVMAARVVWAVGTGVIEPQQALGLTFTTKASAELGARVRRLLETLDSYPGEALVTTYHSFAHQLVSEHGLRIGVEPGARLLAANETHHLAYRVLRDTKLALTGMSGGPGKLVGDVINLDQQMAEQVVTPAQVRASDERVIAAVDALDKTVVKDRDTRAAAQRRSQLTRVVEELRAAKLAADVIDFSDLLRFGVELATGHPDVGKIARDRWRLVMLDEYQDTSVVQATMLAALFGAGHPVTAVGDPMQGIYGWRGASVQAMDDFPTRFSDSAGQRAANRELSVSQRSGPRILATANDVAAPLRDAHPSVVTLRPRVDEAGLVARDGIRAALFESHSQESQWLADRIAEQIDAGTAPERIAVLCRATSDFLPVMEALAQREIPAQVSSVEGLLAQPEVIDVVSTLAVLHDATANPATLRLLLGPRWRIGPRDLAILGRRAAYLAKFDGLAGPGPANPGQSNPGPVDAGQSHPDQPNPEHPGGHSASQPSASGQPDQPQPTNLDTTLARAIAGADPVDLVSLIEAIENPGGQRYPYSVQARERFAALAAELGELRKSISHPLVDLVQAVITTSGLDVEVGVRAREVAGAAATFSRPVAALAGLRELVASFEDLDGDASLGSFLAWIESVEQFGGEPGLEIPLAAGAVQVMTVHKAKGLEWEVVGIPGLTRGNFPSARSRAIWTTSQAEIPHRVRGDRDALPDLAGFGTKAHTTLSEAMKAHSEEEERRLAYVATTRPQRLLLACGHWWGPTQIKPRGPSSYLDAIRENCLENVDEDPWFPEPADDAVNPNRGEAEQFVWPTPADPVARAKRMAAAELVRAAAVDLAVESAGPAADQPVASPAGLELTEAEQSVVDDWDADLRVLIQELEAPTETRSVSLPASLSATALIRLSQDRQEYARSLARPMPAKPNIWARRGTRFHTWVEQLFGQRPLFEEIPGAADEDVYDDEQLQELQEAFLRTEFADRTPFAVEVPFSVVIGGRVVQGRIDAVYREGDQWQVVDWKTSRGADSNPIQLAVYRVALAQQHGLDLDDIRAAFVYVRRGEVAWYDDLPDAEQIAALVRPTAKR